jgi:hypothetical protein
MTERTPCESCGMPIEAGPYCQYCTDSEGNLQEFEERLARMTQWMRRSGDGLSVTEAETRALEHMAAMPAWRRHPALLARRSE